MKTLAWLTSYQLVSWFSVLFLFEMLKNNFTNKVWQLFLFLAVTPKHKHLNHLAGGIFISAELTLILVNINQWLHRYWWRMLDSICRRQIFHFTFHQDLEKVHDISYVNAPWKSAVRISHATERIFSQSFIFILKN